MRILIKEETGQDTGQKVGWLFDFRVSDQADPINLGSGPKQGWRVPDLADPQQQHVAKVNGMKPMIKFQKKKGPCLAVAGGHMKMTDGELVYNIRLAVNFLVSLLKKNQQNVWAVYIKSTTGKPQSLHEGTI